MNITKEHREEIVNNWSLEQVSERAIQGLKAEKTPTIETGFFMALTNALATERGIERLVKSGELKEHDFAYINLVSLIKVHKKQLIKHGRLVN